MTKNKNSKSKLLLLLLHNSTHTTTHTFTDSVTPKNNYDKKCKVENINIFINFSILLRKYIHIRISVKELEDIIPSPSYNIE